MDVPPVRNPQVALNTRVFPLRFGQAEEIAAILNATLSGNGTAVTNAVAQNLQQEGLVAAAPSAGAKDVTVAADATCRKGPAPQAVTEIHMMTGRDDLAGFVLRRSVPDQYCFHGEGRRTGHVAERLGIAVPVGALNNGSATTQDAAEPALRVLFRVFLQKVVLAQLHIQRLPRKPQHLCCRHAVVRGQLDRGFNAHLLNHICGLGHDALERL